MNDETGYSVTQEDLTAHISQQDLLAWLTLWRAPKLGARTFARLESFTSRLADIFEPAFYRDPQHHIPLELQAYLKAPDWRNAERDLAWSQQSDCHILTWHHAHYPARLKEIYDPPPLLFIRGSSACLDHPQQLALVGSRSSTAQGQQDAYEFAYALGMAGWTITSALARGIDGSSHRGALAAQATTIAALGTGLDSIYPQRHAKLAQHICVQGGALVSEFPLGVKALAKNFPRRNRIISGLCRGVLVIEAGLKSGSLITAQYALEQNRDVFAVPGSIHNPLTKGCHALLRQGAILVETIDDILMNFNETMVQSASQAVLPCVPNDVSDAEETLLTCMGWEPCHMDELARRSGLSMSALASLVLELELKGYVQAHTQGYIRLKPR